MASISAFPAQMPGNYGPPGDQKRAHLYVGNLSPRCTEFMLQEIFNVCGPVLGVKIIPDRNFQHGGQNYGFVEYHEVRSADMAVQSLSGRKIFEQEIKVNWAYQNQNAKEDLTNHLHVFCGDLSPEVNDEILRKTFSAFGSLSDARVMWDMNSGKSRGYGFLAFRDRADADQAIATMNGEWLGSRAIRVNWANQKNGSMPGGPGEVYGMNAAPTPQAPLVPGMGRGGPPMGGPPMPMPPNPYTSPPPPQQFATPGGASFDVIVAQTPPTVTTVYVGNLPPSCNQGDLVPLFQAYGYITEIRMQPDRGFSFIKMDNHANAAMAIANLSGTIVQGRPMRCSWGKETVAAPAAAAPPALPAGKKPTPEAYEYAKQYSNGDANLQEQYAQYYMEQVAKKNG